MPKLPRYFLRKIRQPLSHRCELPKLTDANLGFLDREQPDLPELTDAHLEFLDTAPDALLEWPVDPDSL